MILTAKISEKKIRCRVLEGILTAKIANIMSLISAERYENAKVHTIQVKNDLWESIKDVGNSLGVKNISDLVLK